MKHTRVEPTYTDPVCGMKISKKTAAERLDHGNKVYYFCAPVCREAFEADPENYTHHHRQHGIRRS